MSLSERDAKHIRYPHDDALVISTRVGHYEVKHILIDTGNFVDILFYDALVLMTLPQEKLKPVKTPLVSFTGSVAKPLGSIDLPFALGKESRMVDKVLPS